MSTEVFCLQSVRGNEKKNRKKKNEKNKNKKEKERRKSAIKNIHVIRDK